MHALWWAATNNLTLRELLNARVGRSIPADTAWTSMGLVDRLIHVPRATKLFLRQRLPRCGYHSHRFSVWFKILYRRIRQLIQHLFLSKTMYLNIKYVIATRSYEFFNKGTGQ